MEVVIGNVPPVPSFTVAYFELHSDVTSIDGVLLLVLFLSPPHFRNVIFHTTFHWPRDLVYDHQGKLQVTAWRWNHDVVIEGGREFLFLHLQGQLESTRYNGIKSVAVEEKAD